VTTTNKKNHDYSFSGVTDKCLLCGDTKASHEPEPKEEPTVTIKLLSRMRLGVGGDWTEWAAYEPGPASHVGQLLANDAMLNRVSLTYKGIRNMDPSTTVEYKRDGAV
jgi:hypothetical protein